MITVANSVSQCAARLCRQRPEAMLAHARMVGEYVLGRKLAAPGVDPDCYVTIITGRTKGPGAAVFHSGDLVVSHSAPALTGNFSVFSFIKH